MSTRPEGTPRAVEPAPMPHLADHLDHMRLRGLSVRYIETRRLTVRRIARHLGCDPLDATTAQMKAWQRSRRVGIGAMYNEVSHLQEYSSWAVEQQLLDHDPMRVLVTPKLPRRLPRPAPDDLLLQAIADAPPDIRLMLVLAGWQGLRACELAALDRADILDRDIPPVILLHGKGSRDRIVPLGSLVLAEIRRYDPAPWGPVFPRGDGEPGHIRAQRVSQRVSHYLTTRGLPFTLHGCRHRFATQVYRSTLDLRMVQELLGHSSPTTTAIYAGFAVEKSAAALDALSLTLG